MGSTASRFNLCASFSFLIWLQFHSTGLTHTSWCSNWIGHYNLVRWFSLYSHFNHFNKCLIDLHSILGRCLEILHVVILLAPSLSFLSRNFSLVFSIYFISNKDEWESFGIIGSGILNKAILPLIQCVEACWISQIETECTAISTSIESETQWLEFFLTSGIPNL
jgi:hypothetical protein